MQNCEKRTQIVTSTLNSTSNSIPKNALHPTKTSVVQVRPVPHFHTPGLYYMNTLATLSLCKVFIQLQVSQLTNQAIVSAFSFTIFDLTCFLASDILFVYHLNCCLSWAMLKPSILGSVICNLPAFVKKHFLHWSLFLPPDTSIDLKRQIFHAALN